MSEHLKRQSRCEGKWTIREKFSEGTAGGWAGVKRRRADTAKSTYSHPSLSLPSSAPPYFSYSFPALRPTPTAAAKQLGAREADLKKQDAFYREQVARLEERSAQFYKVTTENYHKAADQVNAKFK
ncbi:hypothetical protein CRENBAI_009366 [Crenichthys baileyi]|uniref:Uncharacterized protein n=1 Tax=Crenichthys baileyi TaxID=28760 RepID=A0AAV9R9C4_9TELE